MIDNFLQDKYQSWHLVYEHNETGHGIYLGDIASALDLDFIKSHAIKTVVTAAAAMEHVSYDASVKHVIYALLDAKSETISKLFGQFYELVEKQIKRGNILVHCAAGISRSATLVLAYLIRKESMSFKTAIEFVRKVRTKVCPNLGFERQLKAYEQSLKKQKIEQIDRERKFISKTSEARTHGVQISKLPEISKSKMLELNRLQQQTSQMPRAAFVNISFYNQDMRAKRGLFSRDRKTMNQAESNNFRLKLGGIKHNFSYVKKKQSSISHRSEHHKVQFPSGREQNINLYKMNKINLNNINNFQIIKLNNKEHKFTTEKALNQIQRGPIAFGF